ncbi:glycosyltransferase family 4 protein [Haladaptatus sp. GCM10025707]|uniref:glycosyltransferase family 4 protein n=1 Tax=unclassified Haladaptatus TaxID=2622732 RepID=UPI0023E7E45E|nr:glycosyltransferase family 4 protein [Haladaptatus sp. QDMS2]
MDILSLSIGAPNGDAKWWRISNISNQLQNYGHNVHHVCYGDESLGTKKGLDELERNSTDVTIIDSSLTAASIRNVFHENIVENYDCIYGNNHVSTLFGNLRIFDDVPVIYDIHGDILQEHLLKYESNPQLPNRFSLKSGSKLLTKWVIYKSNLSASSAILSVSKKMKRKLQDDGIPKSKISYITNGVDLDFFSQENSQHQPLKEELGLSSELIVGYVGGFQEWQGVQSLISAAKQIDDDEIIFLIVGKRQGVDDNIRFVPRIPRESVPDYYSVCDILVLPRPHHVATEVAAPTKFAEYAAMGKPILATNVGDAANLIRQYECGVVIENNSAERITEGIAELQSLSQSERKKMGENSRKMAISEFNWEKIGKSLSDTLSKLV